MATRSPLKRALYDAGLVGLLHRLRNRRTLTVAGFHRVLEPDDPRFPEADPFWTVTRGLFAECLDFFQRHYHVVSLEELLAAHRDRRRLPDRCLLISFDDGWADTADTALPELRARGLPAVCFVAAHAVGRTRPFWREAIVAAVRGRRLSPELREALWLGTSAIEDAPPEIGFGELIGRLEELEPERREALLAEHAELDPPHCRREMVSAEELAALEAGGVAIGAHGATHEPLEGMADVAAELAGARAELARHLGRAPEDGPRAFSFPHGRFRAGQLAEASAAGFELLFTSEEHLNPTGHGGLSHVLGRICVDERQVSGPEGALAPELLALWLVRRPIGGRRGGGGRE